MFNQAKHPINLTIRFLLEIAVLATVATWGFTNFEGFYSYFIGIGAPISMSAMWGIFAVPNDPSRSGKTVVKTKGTVRLFLESIFFITGSYALYSIGYTSLFYSFSIIAILHYTFSLDRINWLLKQ